MVLMDSWYAAKELMLHIERSGKMRLLPAQRQPPGGRRFGESPKPAYRRVDSLEWMETEIEAGKNVHLKDAPERSSSTIVPAGGFRRPHGVHRH